MNNILRNILIGKGTIWIIRRYGSNVINSAVSTKIVNSENIYQNIFPIFKKSLNFAERSAINDSIGEFSYFQLYMSAKNLSFQISNICGSAACANVSYLCGNNILTPMTQWACWMSGQVAMPICAEYPYELLKYIIRTSQAKLLISSSDNECLANNLASKLDIPLLIIDHRILPPTDFIYPAKTKQTVKVNDQFLIEGALNDDFYKNSNAMILHKLDMDGKIKYVQISHTNLHKQITSLTKAWKYSIDDVFLNILPLNNYNGYIISVLCPLSVGGKVIIRPDYSHRKIWSALLGVNSPTKDRVTGFIAIPSTFNILAAEFESVFSTSGKSMKDYIKNNCRQFVRLMVSGTAPLFVQTFNSWFNITGHKILEYYGKTEMGITMCDPYKENYLNNKKTVPGTIGIPLPGITILLTNLDYDVIITRQAEDHKLFFLQNIHQKRDSEIKIIKKEAEQIDVIVGQLSIMNKQFIEESNNLQEYIDQFHDEFVRTEDTAVFTKDQLYILNYDTDIVQMAGYEISRSEIEAVLFRHPFILDVAILTGPNNKETYSITAICVPQPQAKLQESSLKHFYSHILPSIMHPIVIKIVNNIPRSTTKKIYTKKLIQNHL